MGPLGAIQFNPRSTGSREFEEPGDSLERLFEMSVDLMVVAGLDGYFKRVNAAWTTVLGWSQDELLATPTADFLHPDDRARTLAARDLLADGAPLLGLVNRYRCKDGTYRWLDWRSVPSTDRRFVYGVARDITEQRRAEEQRELIQAQLTAAERMASIGRLAAGVAHEINNPLAFMIVNLGLVKQQLPALLRHAPGARLELEQMVSESLDGAARVRRIVMGLKTFARSGDEQRTLVGVRGVIELSLSVLGSQLRRRARLVEVYEETPVIEADEARLGEVFMGLFVNAFQAIPEEGGPHEVRVRTSTDASGRAVVEIADTGVGITPAVMAHIFEPFFTTKPVGIGTGLGLSICQNIVAALGGEITVSSEPGRGATFRVALPPARPR